MHKPLSSSSPTHWLGFRRGRVGGIDYTECSCNTFKQTHCGYDEGWHTITAVSTAEEIIYFVDGKETWSTKIIKQSTAYANGSYYWPAGFDPAANSPNPILRPIFIGTDINHGAIPTWDNADFQVDYFRYYTPTNGNAVPFGQNTNQIVPGTNQNWTNNNYNGQSFSNGIPVTLESLDNPVLLPTNEPAENNRGVQIANHNNGPSSSIATTNIAYSNEPGLQKVYYQGLDGQLYNAYLQSGKWYEYPLENGYVTVNDVIGGITVNGDRIYYVSNIANGEGGNEIKFFQWYGNINQWVNYATGSYCQKITNAPVSLQVDELDRLWFIGTDNFIHAWVPNSGVTTGTDIVVIDDVEAFNGLIMHPCGCLAFCINSNGDLVQHSWWGNWSNQGVISDNIGVLPEMALNPNGTLYVVGGVAPGSSANDFDVYSYVSNYYRLNSDGLQKLGPSGQCSEYDNALAFLTSLSITSSIALSPDGNIVYYLGWDNNIWYYFNDHDQQMQPNWYRTQLTHNSGAGIFTIQPTTGQLFYANGEGLSTIDWESADNPLTCPNNHPYNPNNPNPNAAAVYMYKIPNDSNTTFSQDSLGFSVSVYPNPSAGSFIFIMNGTSQPQAIDIVISNITGETVTVLKKQWQGGNTPTLIWDASAIPPGIYYYNIKLADGNSAGGKLVKM